MRGHTWKGGECGAVDKDALVLHPQQTALQCDGFLNAAVMFERESIGCCRCATDLSGLSICRLRKEKEKTTLFSAMKEKLMAKLSFPLA